MEADAKKAPGMPISTHTTATMETIILTARTRIAGLLSDALSERSRSEIPSRARS